MKRTIIIVTLIIIFLSACGTNNRTQSNPQGPQNPLQIPELLDSRDSPEMTLVMQNGSHEFFAGIPSDTQGFNGDYLGPTIRLYKDTDATITFTNNIGEPTTIHGHGLHVNGEIDGGPQSVIQPGESWQITIPVRQEAGMSWYHPHLMGKTAHHVHAGLAGIYLIEDENSQALDLPKAYGVNDIPIIVQDRSFTDGKMNHYAVNEQQLENGLRENTLVVNGTLNAYHNVPQGWVRLRLLNGSNARFYRFSFSNNQPFFKIATEGGFLNQPISLDSIDMAPGERNEIMIDLSDGANATLIADLLPTDPGENGLFAGNIPQANIVELRVDPMMPVSGTLPNSLNNIAYFNREEATQIRNFSLEMDGNEGNNADEADNMMGNMNLYSINGQSMNMSFINQRVKKGEVEIWRITGEQMPHPFHMHGVSFQILTHNGEPPAEADRGWKDTVVVGDGITEIILRFDYEATESFPYMFHCHILEHEDAGMMGQFTVEGQ
ncbi:MAG: multicopper oxidase domain-containing protein [Chloroflexota bacterium]